VIIPKVFLEDNNPTMVEIARDFIHPREKYIN